VQLQRSPRTHLGFLPVPPPPPPPGFPAATCPAHHHHLPACLVAFGSGSCLPALPAGSLPAGWQQFLVFFFFHVWYFLCAVLSFIVIPYLGGWVGVLLPAPATYLHLHVSTAMGVPTASNMPWFLVHLGSLLFSLSGLALSWLGHWDGLPLSLSVPLTCLLLFPLHHYLSLYCLYYYIYNTLHYILTTLPYTSYITPANTLAAKSQQWRVSSK